MQKQLIYSGVNFILYQPNNLGDSENIGFFDDWEGFTGCDYISAYVFFVNKEKVQNFKNQINELMKEIDSLNKEELEEYNYEFGCSVNHFTFLQKEVEGSEYDFFVTNFNQHCIREDYYFVEELYNSKMQKLKDIAYFFMSGGADVSNDENLFNYAVKILDAKGVFQNASNAVKEEVKKIRENTDIDSFDCSGEVSLFNELIRMYFKNIHGGESVKEIVDCM